MATPDFSKIWASNSPLSEYTFLDADYLTGWNFIGAVPPDRRMFDTLQRLTDTKLKWVFDNAVYDDDMTGFLFLRQKSTAYTVGAKCRVKAGPIDIFLQCTSAGTTASSDLTQLPSGVNVGDTFTDGSVTWQVMRMVNQADLIPLAPKASPAFTGTPTAPTAAKTTNNTQIATTAYVKTNLGDYAPLASPALTGTPTAPTATAGTNTTQIATTAFVKTAVDSSSPDLSAYAKLASPAFTGTPTAPTATAGTNTTQLATTAFVQTAITNIDLSLYAPKASPALTGIPTAPTAATATNNTQIATTAFVKAAITAAAPDLSIYAPKASPALTGTPTAPTAAAGTNTTQIATTAFVKSAVDGIDLSAYAPKASPALTGIPTAPTAASGTNTTQIATTAFVKSAVDGIDLSAYATKDSPALTGTPTAPTATDGTDTTQIATTAFVQAVLYKCFQCVDFGMHTNGYIKFYAKKILYALPFIFQWGMKDTRTDGAGPHSFPIAFEHAVFAMTCAGYPMNGEANIGAYPADDGASLTQYMIHHDEGGGVVYWMAIGY